VVSIADGFDLNGPAAEIILAVLAGAAKMERLAINERIAAARERVEAEGRNWGRPRRIDPAALARIVVLRGEGRTIREIAVALRILRSTVGQAVARPKKLPANAPLATLSVMWVLPRCARLQPYSPGMSGDGGRVASKARALSRAILPVSSCCLQKAEHKDEIRNGGSSCIQ